MTLSHLTELDAVNIVLAAAKQKAVSTLADASHEEASEAHRVLLEVSREVQGAGWYFNTEVNVQMALTADGEIPVAPDIVHLDWESSSVDPIIRGGRLFDRVTNSYKFSTAPKVCLIRLLPWTDLPPEARLLIARRAARIHAVRKRGKAALNESLIQDEEDAHAALVDYECRQGDYNLLPLTRRWPDGLGY